MGYQFVTINSKDEDIKFSIASIECVLRTFNEDGEKCLVVKTRSCKYIFVEGKDVKSVDIEFNKF